MSSIVLRSLLTGLCLLLCTGPAAGQDTVARSGDAVSCTSPEDVKWLLGTWETTGGDTVFRETWIRLTSATWEGTGQTLESDSRAVRSEEALRLVGMRGGLFYVAKVDHNPFPTAFAATDCTDARVVFENPNHDFPKRIAYRLIDSDHVTVTVDDGAGDGFVLELVRTGD